MEEGIIPIAVIRQDIVAAAVQMYIRLLRVHAKHARPHLYLYVIRKLIAHQQADTGAIIIASLCPAAHHRKTQQIRQICAQMSSATARLLRCAMEVM